LRALLLEGVKYNFEGWQNAAGRGRGSRKVLDGAAFGLVQATKAGQI
jgi:hypothetical protein